MSKLVKELEVLAKICEARTIFKSFAKTVNEAIEIIKGSDSNTSKEEEEEEEEEEESNPDDLSI